MIGQEPRSAGTVGIAGTDGAVAVVRAVLASQDRDQVQVVDLTGPGQDRDPELDPDVDLVVLAVDTVDRDTLDLVTRTVTRAGLRPVVVAPVRGPVTREIVTTTVAAGAVDVVAADDPHDVLLVVERELLRAPTRIQLIERVKELTALHQVVGRLLVTRDPVEACRSIATSLAASLQYPDDAQVTVAVDDVTVTDGRDGPAAVALHHDVVVDRVRCGYVEAAYVARHDFLDPEETALVRSLADLLSGWVRQHSASDRFAALFRSSLDPIAFVDDRACILECNPAFAQLAGSSPDRLAGAPLGSLYLSAPDHPERFELAWDELLRRGTYEDEFPTRFPDGTLRRVAVSAVAHARPGLHLVTFRDVTDRWHAVRQLRRSKKRFRDLAERLAEGIFVFRGSPPHMEYVNPALSMLTGVERPAIYALPTTLGGTLDASTARTLWDRLTATAGSQPLIEVDVRVGGETRRLRIRGTRLAEHGGDVTGVLAVVTDLTREHAQQAALEAALAHERHLGAMKTGFVRAVSHELRTPLTSVRGFVELLLRREVSPDDQQRFLRRIEAGAIRLERIVDDVLDLERLEHVEVGPVPRTVDLAEVVPDAIADLATGGRELRLDLVATPVTGDPELLQRVVRHLAHNAVRHTPESASITIATRTPGTLVVEDDGPGVPAGLRGRVFEPFEQGPSPSADASPGTGIGLTLAASIVRAHGGTITLGDRVGGGARVEVRLPAPPDTAHPPAG